VLEEEKRKKRRQRTFPGMREDNKFMSVDM
jgi:hypothetical protein